MIRALALAFAALLVVGLGLSGCGGEPAEFAKEASYTPESLAQEFALRYKNLPDRGTAQAKAAAAAQAKARSAVPDVDAQSKSARSEEATKGANAPTLDRLIAETDARLGLIAGMSRGEAGKKFIESLGKDGGIDAGDLGEIRTRLSR